MPIVEVAGSTNGRIARQVGESGGVRIITGGQEEVTYLADVLDDILNGVTTGAAVRAGPAVVAHSVGGVGAAHDSETDDSIGNPLAQAKNHLY